MQRAYVGNLGGSPAMGRLVRLLWVDCASAGASGAGVLAARSWLAPVYGLPGAVLAAMAGVSLGYAALGFALARRRAPERVPWLIGGNVAWAAACVAIALFHRDALHAAGAALLGVEAVYVLALAALEARALRAVRAPNRRALS